MSLSATVQWDVRTTGSDANGGSFDPGVTSPGTDYSQQSSAQVAFTDLVIGATTTQLTSAANPFTSAHVGNTINITSGTGFTAGRYTVVSVSGAVATMDRAVGTAASTGGHGNLGGSMLTPGGAMAVIASGNAVWVKAGTYTITATVQNASGTSFSLLGYSATHGDNLPGVTITTATGGINIITLSPGTASPWIHNLTLSSTSSGGDGIFVNDLNDSLVVTNCNLLGSFVNGINGLAHVGVAITVINTFITGCSGYGIGGQGTALMVANCVVSGCTGVGIQGSSLFINVSRSICVGNSVGVQINGTTSYTTILDSTLSYNVLSGIVLNNTSWFGNLGNDFIAQNNIMYGNSAWGIDALAASPGNSNLYLNHNAYGGNTTGNLNNVPAGVGDVILSAVPFTSHSTGDFSLNSAAGGGNSCKGVGYPGTFPGGLSVGKLDIGAVQSGGSSGGGAFVFLA